MNDVRRAAYIAIDLKSFFASVECVERGLNPLTTNLVVADVSRTEKTICLAVSPSLKAHGIGGRPRLFEVVQRVREINALRRINTPARQMTGKSTDDNELKAHADWAVDYIAATPHMARYMDYSTRIYGIYLKYIAPEDIHVYSIDEVFIDATAYLDTYRMTAHELAMTMIRDILRTTGITATAGIGTNMYLCKIAMDIMAKHQAPDADGVRIAELDEASYRQQLWAHQPLTDFWRVGRGTARRLAQYGMYTMGDVALQSVHGEELLYKLFGVNAELLIDHAWGWEPCTVKAIKAYRPHSSSFSHGQVLQCPYTWDKARVVVMEMAGAAAMQLLDKQLVCDQIVLYIGYDAENLSDAQRRANYSGATVADHYGRAVPRPAHGSTNLNQPSSSEHVITDAATAIFDRIADRNLLIRRINITTNHVSSEEAATRQQKPVQLDLFSDSSESVAQQTAERERLSKERRLQEAVLQIKKKFGKNAMLKGLNFAEGATAIERNKQIGGHKA